MTDVLDLGAFDEPVLVFGGPYGNLQATRALLDEAARRGIAPSRLLCTGDVVAYCADPQATVDLIREAGIAVVMGNCEESLGSGTEDCGCGFAAGSSCDLLSAQWFAYAGRTLDDGAKAWMQGLPRRIAFTLAGRRLAAIHGGVERINRYVFPATPAADKAAEIARAGAEGVIGGHCGLPFTEIVEGRLWHNAGAIGLPANDGTPRVWYSTLSPSDDGIAFAHHALAYDHETAAAAMRDRGLPAAYAESLGTGLWPADDVMPEADRRTRGRPLAPAPVLWRHDAGRRKRA
ncbi:MAG: metallophosphatase family protein [Rhodospirillales bacterium]|nr:metallophosphatase family protein [Rhodospirillales bacterium]MDH3911996.1 metallophosphatase family protein [Rhodospirillales bacterium]MDH3918166.1 metallophosphatase family protein [Rhodospirillales bacterium]MDH3965908.1 metallophosphatase family protein [Rhodospirillales bacterium]